MIPNETSAADGGISSLLAPPSTTATSNITKPFFARRQTPRRHKSAGPVISERPSDDIYTDDDESESEVDCGPSPTPSRSSRVALMAARFDSNKNGSSSSLLSSNNSVASDHTFKSWKAAAPPTSVHAILNDDSSSSSSLVSDSSTVDTNTHYAVLQRLSQLKRKSSFRVPEVVTTTPSNDAEHQAARTIQKFFRRTCRLLKQLQQQIDDWQTQLDTIQQEKERELLDIQHTQTLSQQQIALELGDQDSETEPCIVEQALLVDELKTQLSIAQTEHQQLAEQNKRLSQEKSRLCLADPVQEEERFDLQDRIRVLQDQNKQYRAVHDQEEKWCSELQKKVELYKRAKEDRKAQRKRCESYIDRVIRMVQLQVPDEVDLFKAIKKLKKDNEKEYKDKKTNSGTNKEEDKPNYNWKKKRSYSMNNLKVLKRSSSKEDTSSLLKRQTSRDSDGSDNEEEEIYPNKDGDDQKDNNTSKDNKNGSSTGKDDNGGSTENNSSNEGPFDWKKQKRRNSVGSLGVMEKKETDNEQEGPYDWKKKLGRSNSGSNVREMTAGSSVSPKRPKRQKSMRKGAKSFGELPLSSTNTTDANKNDTTTTAQKGKTKEPTTDDAASSTDPKTSATSTTTRDGSTSPKRQSSGEGLPDKRNSSSGSLSSLQRTLQASRAAVVASTAPDDNTKANNADHKNNKRSNSAKNLLDSTKSKGANNNNNKDEKSTQNTNKSQKSRRNSKGSVGNLTHFWSKQGGKNEEDPATRTSSSSSSKSEGTSKSSSPKKSSNNTSNKSSSSKNRSTSLSRAVMVAETTNLAATTYGWRNPKEAPKAAGKNRDKKKDKNRKSDLRELMKRSMSEPGLLKL